MDHQFSKVPDVSIIIVAWNVRDLLARCLETVSENLHSCPELQAETFVVDNGSTDGSVQMVEEDFSWVTIMANKENIGFAQANNQAIQAATGHTVLLLNPDTEMMPGSLYALIAFLEENPDVGAVGSRLVNPDRTLQNSCRPLPTHLREFWHLFHLDTFKVYSRYPMETWDWQQPYKVDVIQGACLLIRATALAQIGLLDTRFFIYSEEVDICHRLSKAGWRLDRLPTSEVIHYGGQSTQQVAAEMFLHLYWSKILYFHKYYGFWGSQLYKLILSAAAVARLLISPLVWLEQPNLRRQHLTLVGHYGRLLKSLAAVSRRTHESAKTMIEL